MAVAVTGGRIRNQFARIYDRLRKRSDRNIGNNRSKYLGGQFGSWTVAEHEAYVAGVRDALNAVEALQENA